MYSFSKYSDFILSCMHSFVYLCVSVCLYMYVYIGGRGGSRVGEMNFYIYYIYIGDRVNPKMAWRRVERNFIEVYLYM